MAGVVVVGGINQDTTVRVARRPNPGETVVGEGPQVSAGGKGANMAVAAAAAGASVAMCGAVGADDAGRTQIDLLASAGVGVASVAVLGDSPTGAALILVTPDGENSIAVGTGANGRLTEDQVWTACAGAAVVLAQTEVGAGPALAAARSAAAGGARFVLSPAPVVALSHDVLAMADPLVVNEEEATDLLGGDWGHQDVAAALRAYTGARSVVVSLGADGVRAADANGSWHAAAPATHVVDTTGAGDVLAGTLAAGLAKGETLQEALQLAVSAAAESVRHVGARP